MSGSSASQAGPITDVGPADQAAYVHAWAQAEMSDAADDFIAAGEEFDDGRLREQVVEVLKVWCCALSLQSAASSIISFLCEAFIYLPCFPWRIAASQLWTTPQTTADERVGCVGCRHRR